MHLFQQALDATRILRPPKHRLATFGTTTMNYVLVSLPPGDVKASRIREGAVTAERPQILTPDLIRERFSGFGEEGAQYQEHLQRLYGVALRGLEYRFRNELQQTSVEQTPLPDVIERVKRSLDERDLPRTALIQGPDDHWSLGIMKFILDMTLSSFSGNIKELDERGFFNPEERQERRTRAEIEQLFAATMADRTRIPALANRLRESGLFSDYEDRFFALVRS